MQAPEIELKFPVADVEAFRRSLPSDLELETERTFESNTLYDTPERNLRGRHQLLRIRHYGERCTITHKRSPNDSDDDATQRYKTRIETESLVSDGDALAEVFTQLGYAPVFRYEKFRTEWSVESGGHLVLDETPIGTWVELEGSPEWIDTMLARLGIDPVTTITLSYGKLFLEWRDRTGSLAEHLTFDEISEHAAVPAALVSAH